MKSLFLAAAIVAMIGPAVSALAQTATTPPHLHYGIYTVSGAIDPYPLLRQASRR